MCAWNLKKFRLRLSLSNLKNSKHIIFRLFLNEVVVFFSYCIQLIISTQIYSFIKTITGIPTIFIAHDQYVIENIWFWVYPKIEQIYSSSSHNWIHSHQPLIRLVNPQISGKQGAGKVVLLPHSYHTATTLYHSFYGWIRYQTGLILVEPILISGWCS